MLIDIEHGIHAPRLGEAGIRREVPVAEAHAIRTSRPGLSLDDTSTGYHTLPGGHHESRNEHTSIRPGHGQPGLALPRKGQ